MKKICLSMIVKNESHCIERCLNSVKPFIDYWVISDTGSTDNTIEIIKETMKDIPGQILENKWENFSFNRNIVLEEAKKHGDFVFTIDADDEFISNDTNILRNLEDYELYAITLVNNTCVYNTTQVVSSKSTAKYTNVLHEYIDSTISPKLIKNCFIKYNSEGSRSKDPEKYIKDAEILEKEIITNPTPRNIFYLAQSYKNAKIYDKALENYYKRINMKGYDEEIKFSFLQIAIINELVQANDIVVINSYLRAANASQFRAEPLLFLAKFCNNKKYFDQAYFYAKQAVKIQMPKHGLFVDASVYNWRAIDELSVAAFYIGEYKESKALLAILLNNKTLPENEKERIAKNLSFIPDYTKNQ